MKMPTLNECLRQAKLAPVVDQLSWQVALDTLHGWAQHKTALGKINEAEIESDYLHGTPANVREARDHLMDAMLLQLPASIRSRLSEHRVIEELVYCRWAAPHTDNMFDGELFLSLVLGTGPSPYRVESLIPTFKRHVDGRRIPRFGFERQSLELAQGALFLLDPLVPHYASPLTPHQDSLLSLLQLRLPYKDRRERARWIKQIAPLALEGSTSED